MSDLMPCFWPENAEKEGNIIGRLLTGYGELEFEMCHCLAVATPGNFNDAIKINEAAKLLFGQRGEEKRITTADNAMRAAYASAHLAKIYDETISDMHWCRKIRNQYSHCTWYYTATEGLHFINLEDWAKSPTPTLTDGRLPLTTALLMEQENYFMYVKRSFWHLTAAYQNTSGQRAKRNLISAFPLPPKLPRPPMHG